MHLFAQAEPLRAYLFQQRQAGHSWGFVPTMGALHEGHLSLVHRSKAENVLTVASIYVNPTQFNNPEDLAKYPRTLEKDQALLQEAGCDVLFTPADRDVYPQAPKTKLDFGHLETVMEGKFRPGHFNGVGLVVAKLFHLVQPEVAYFGQKDLQQFLVIHQLVQDLTFPVRLVRCPTAREADGLAMSSRNARLDSEQRQVAPALHWALNEAKETLRQTQSPQAAERVVQQLLSPLEGVLLEYFEVADAQTLMKVEQLPYPFPIALCIAAYIGNVRLIDNLILDEHELR